MSFLSRGKSGRIVIEIDPKTKRALYLALEQDQKTLKDWFLESANQFITSSPNTLIKVEKNKINASMPNRE